MLMKLIKTCCLLGRSHVSYLFFSLRNAFHILTQHQPILFCHVNNSDRTLVQNVSRWFNAIIRLFAIKCAHGSGQVSVFMGNWFNEALDLSMGSWLRTRGCVSVDVGGRKNRFLVEKKPVTEVCDILVNENRQTVMSQFAQFISIYLFKRSFSMS